MAYKPHEHQKNYKSKMPFFPFPSLFFPSHTYAVHHKYFLEDKFPKHLEFLGFDSCSRFLIEKENYGNFLYYNFYPANILTFRCICYWLLTHLNQLAYQSPFARKKRRYRLYYSLHQQKAQKTQYQQPQSYLYFYLL